MDIAWHTARSPRYGPWCFMRVGHEVGKLQMLAFDSHERNMDNSEQLPNTTNHHDTTIRRIRVVRAYAVEFMKFNKRIADQCCFAKEI